MLTLDFIILKKWYANLELGVSRGFCFLSFHTLSLFFTPPRNRGTEYFSSLKAMCCGTFMAMLPGAAVKIARLFGKGHLRPAALPAAVAASLLLSGSPKLCKHFPCTTTNSRAFIFPREIDFCSSCCSRHHSRPPLALA